MFRRIPQTPGHVIGTERRDATAGGRERASARASPAGARVRAPVRKIYVRHKNAGSIEARYGVEFMIGSKFRYNRQKSNAGSPQQASDQA